MDISSMGMMQYRNQVTPPRVNAADDAKLKEACSDFEAIFIKQMLDSMRKTVQKTGMTDGGYAEELYQDMLYDQYAEKMAKTAHLGVAELMYRQLSTQPGEKLL